MKKTKETGIEIDTVLGDTAYSEKENLAFVKEEKIELVSKLHPIITQGNRKSDQVFEFNKDAGMFVCPTGHWAIKKILQSRKNEKQNVRYKFMFDIEKCKVCLLREGCYKEGAKSKTYSLTIKPDLHADDLTSTL